MRHQNKINALGRTSTHRKAMLSNMATSLIVHKHITTTTAKAKALRRYVEPLLTRAKQNNTHNRRIVFSLLRSKDAVDQLFGDVAEKIANRPGGYTRIIKVGFRPGDAADMALIELVDYSLLNGASTATAVATEATPKKRTRRGSSKTTGGKTETKAGDRTTEKKTATKTSNAPKIRQRKTGGA
ncbi:MAG TPA: 50S ribosomal protein L17 [Cyclobacteriaceae bacterium]|nr:50S ribosomal protein L17 [Cyclobacteriaceae bacterium]